MPRYKARQQLIEQFGSRCERCGYNRCLAALQFHHRDSHEKSKWSSQSVNNRGKVSFAEIREHPARFVLLCANCHFEEHDRLFKAQATYAVCLNCGTSFPTQPNETRRERSRFCSRACQHLHRAKEASQREQHIERFWKHVRQTPDCWLWTGHINYHGYAMMSLKQPNGRNAQRPMHRFAYELHFGPIPQGAQVAHTCTNLTCVNPQHLQLKGKKWVGG